MQSPVFRDSQEAVPFVHRPEVLQQTKSVCRTVFDVGMNNGGCIFPSHRDCANNLALVPANLGTPALEHCYDAWPEP